MYASFLGISEALHLDLFHQPLKRWFFDSLERFTFIERKRSMSVVRGPLSVVKNGAPNSEFIFPHKCDIIHS